MLPNILCINFSLSLFAFETLKEKQKRKQKIFEWIHYLVRLLLSFGLISHVNFEFVTSFEREKENKGKFNITIKVTKTTKTKPKPKPNDWRIAAKESNEMPDTKCTQIQHKLQHTV